MPKLSKAKRTKPFAASFPVVGIGGPAGGPDAYKNFLQTIPAKSGMAYVFVHYPGSPPESLLPDVFSRMTPVPVQVLTNNIQLACDHIYILPANKLAVAVDGVLQLRPRPPDETNRPIDVFFTSLAQVYKKHAVGILLSGAGADGTEGLRSIKENGGVTFSQDGASPAYDDDPRPAMGAGVADFVLSPENMMRQLLQLIFSRPAIPGQRKKAIPPSQDDGTLHEILLLLHTRRLVDFEQYKKNTIRRRMARRMAMHGIRTPAGYLELLKTSEAELDLLFDDMLIPVTEFLRDRKPFLELKNSVFPLLVKGKSISEPLRIWVPGCATGEEAYSIAICLREFLGNDAARIKIQLYATDVSQKAVMAARTALYTPKQLEMFSADQLKKFFIKVDAHYQVVKFIRDFCVFAHHNFLSDPPFARLDLISCRNVLIYMEPVLQKKAFDMFHYALKEGGFLLLGKLETTTGSAELFTPFTNQEKIYLKKQAQSQFIHTVFSTRKKISAERATDRLRPESGKPDFRKTADDILLQEYTPAGVVVNEEAEIVHFRGDTSPFLIPPTGKPTANLLKMARPGLSFELRTGIYKAKAINSIVIKEGIPVRFNGLLQQVTIKIIPLLRTARSHFLILFQDAGSTSSFKVQQQKGHGKRGSQPPDPKDLHIQQLDLELTQLREDIRSITEDQESFNEELQSANEELLSGSEELQSLNEELETSKEEVESSNEQLLIVNQELLESNRRINDAKNYSDSIIATIHEPFIILNEDLVVRHANRPYYKIFHTKGGQADGQLFYEMENRQWDVPELRTLLHKITLGKTSSDCVEITHDFRGAGRRVMVVNATLMKRRSDPERLLLLAIVDVTDRREAEKKLEALNLSLEGKVQYRTKELAATNRSLDKSNLELQQSNEDLQQFAHVASHDLKEPIRKIKTFSSLLEADATTILSASGKTYLSKLQSASDRMLKMVDGVLAYSMINAFEQLVQMVDLEEMLKQIKADLELLILEKEAVITFAGLPRIEGATVLLYQLFYNLIKNSLKFTREGKKQLIAIHATPIRLGSKDAAEITVRDTGIGFNQDEAEKIFITFTRLHAKDQYEGTGLGLSLCKKIVHRHGGTILARGKKGEGAVFTVTLPLQQAIDYI